jgi:hypothetical protein
MASHGLLKPNRLKTGFDDMCPMGEPIDHRPAQARILKNRRMPHSLIE